MKERHTYAEIIDAYEAELAADKKIVSNPRQDRLLNVRNTIVSALFQEPQTLHDLEAVVGMVVEPGRCFASVHREDVLESLLVLSDEGKVRLLKHGVLSHGHFELLPHVTSSLWELPPESPIS